MKIHKKYIFEFISILLGVSVALVINTAWSGYEHHKLAKTAKEHLYNEVADNLLELDSILLLHEETSKVISSLVNEIKEKKSASDKEDTVEKNFQLKFPLLSSSAWETAKISNAVTYMEFDKVSQFNTSYTLQEVYLHTIESFMEHSFMGLQLLEEEEKLMQMKSFIENILSHEYSLKKSYKKIIEEKD